jgi:hypothetical protein
MSSLTCARCGQAISTVGRLPGEKIVCPQCGEPATSTVTPPRPAGGGWLSGTNIAVAAILAIVAALMCGGFLLYGIYPSLIAARKASASNHLKQLGLALLVYETEQGAFPPAIVRDANGKALYSGFVLLLPLLERQDIYDKWKLDEPWDSPNNLVLSRQALDVFQHPGSLSSEPARTDFQFSTGPGAVFEGGGSCADFDIQDRFNTVFLISTTGGPKHWSEPAVGWDGTKVQVPVLGADGDDPYFAFSDGSVKRVDRNSNPAFFKAISTRAGRERVEVPF